MAWLLGCPSRLPQALHQVINRHPAATLCPLQIWGYPHPSVCLSILSVTQAVRTAQDPGNPPNRDVRDVSLACLSHVLPSLLTHHLLHHHQMGAGSFRFHPILKVSPWLGSGFWVPLPASWG